MGGEDELVIFSFYSDVCQHPHINELGMTVSQNVQQLLIALDRHLNHWKRYRLLWEKNRAVVSEKFAARKPSCVMYDDKLQFYAGIRQEVTLEPLSKNEHIIHLNLEPLAITVRENAVAWICSLGSLLNKSAREDLFSLRDEILVLNMQIYSVWITDCNFVVILYVYLIFIWNYFLCNRNSLRT